MSAPVRAAACPPLLSWRDSCGEIERPAVCIPAGSRFCDSGGVDELYDAPDASVNFLLGHALSQTERFRQIAIKVRAARDAPRDAHV
jgi:hypothetical protein|eukprot:376544-Prymnesium_polylepis.2